MQTDVRTVIATPRWAGQRTSARLRSAAPATAVVVVAAILVSFEPSAVVTTFATVFLGVFFEALPFLLLGVLVSAVVQTFVAPGLVERPAPRGRLRAARTA